MRLAPFFSTIVGVGIVSAGSSTFAIAQAPVAAAIAVSPDGIDYAKTTADNLVEIRNRNQPTTTQPLITLFGPKGHITALAFSSDGAFIAGASEDRRVYVWRVSDGRSVGQMIEPDDPQPDQKRVSHVGAIAFNPAGTELGLVDDGFKWLIRFSGSGPADLTRRDAIVTTAPLLSLSADGHGGWVAGDGIGSFHFYDALLTQLSATPSMVAGAIRSMDVSPDGLLLATGDDSKQVKVWYFGSAATASQAGHFGLKERLQAKATVVSVAFGADSKNLQFADAASNVSTWLVPGSDTIATPPGTLATNPPQTAPGSVGQPPANATPPANPVTAATGGATPPATTSTPPSVTPPATTQPPATQTTPATVTPAPDTTTPPLVKRDPDKTAAVVKAPTPTKAPTKVASVPPPAHRLTATLSVVKSLVGHSDYVNSVAFSDDGLSIASASRDKTVRLWDVSTGGQRIIGKHDGYVSCVAFSPVGSLLASGGWDDHIKLFQMPEGTPKDEGGKLDHHTSYVLSLAFSPDGKYLADGSNDKTARVFSFDNGTSKSSSLLPDGIAAVAFSPDGSLIAGGCLDGTIYVWDAKTMEVRHKLVSPSKKPIFSVTFLDNSALVAAGRAGALYVWRIASAKQIGTVNAGGQDIFALAYSPKDHIVASGGADHVIRLWSASDLDQPGKAVAPLTIGRQHTNTVRAIAFSPDGKTMASGSWDDNIVVWDVKTNAESDGSTAMATSAQP